MLEFVLLLGSLAILLISANYFVDGIAGIAERLGVPKIVIGMTLVAFGTSTPELVVNSISAWRGVTDLAFGNIIGACLVNVGVVLALTAMINPLRIEASVVTRELPFLAFSVLIVLVISLDSLLDNGAPNHWSRNDGIILLFLFAIFLLYSVRHAIRVRYTDAFITDVQDQPAPNRGYSILILTAIAVAGFLGVSFSAQWTVDYAVSIARSFGVSEAIIGLTIISVGTTLPELSTCLIAARKGDADLALGNIIGSNLFNLLCIGGIVSTLHPVDIPAGGILDVAVMAFLSAILLPFALLSGHTITRREGAFLMIVYLVYLSYRLYTAA